MLALLLLLASAPEGQVRETRLEASLLDGGSIRATVRFRVELGDTSREIPLSLLEVDDARVSDVTAFDGGRPLPVTLEPSASRQKRGRIVVSSASADVVDLELHYRVSGAVTREGTGLVSRFPVPILDLPPTEARVEAFSATVVLPEGYVLVEGFPTGFERVDESSFAVTLPLVPAFLTLRASTEPRFLTFGRSVDLGALALLAILGAVGVRRGLRTAR